MILAGLCVLGFILGQVQNRARDNHRFDVLTTVIQSVVEPGASVAVWTMTSTGDLWAGVRDARGMRVEIDRLRAMEAAFRQYQESVDLLAARLSNLQRMHDLPTDTGRVKVFARVIGNFPLQNRITLDRGSRHGLTERMAVMSAGGLVGWIETVDANRSQVLLMSSPALKIAAKVLADPLVIGIVRGETTDQLVLEALEPNEVHAGELVVTSGFSETIPEGIPIGVVIDSHEDRNFGTRRILILPHVRAGTFNEVYVLK